MSTAPYVIIINAVLNMVQTIALAYIAHRWRNGSPADKDPPKG